MKYKEIRMLVIHTIIFFVASASVLYFFMQQDIVRALIASLITLIILQLLALKNTLKIFDDGCVIYSYKFVAILPIYVDFGDIKSIGKITKHTFIIEHSTKSKVYIVNAPAFCKELKEKLDIYNKENSK